MAKIYEYKDSILGIIHKNKRRIIASIRQNQIRRIKGIILVLIICMSNVFAIENNEIKYGEYKLECETYPYMYVTYHSVMQPVNIYYYLDGDKRQIAYCLDRGLIGPEKKENYITDVTSKIEDNKLRMIVLNSYPYKSIEELGLVNEYEAVFASQFAIWCYTSNINVDEVLPISQMNDRVVDCIRKIYDSRNNDIASYEINVLVGAKNERIEKIDGKNCVVKDIEVAGKNINSYNITCEDKNVKVIKDVNGYKAYIPLDTVKDKYTAKINVNFNANENVVLFGAKKTDDEQNMAITLNKTFDTNIPKSISFETSTTNLVVYKTDRESNNPLENATFSISDALGIEYGNYKTNDDGKIELAVKYVGQTDIKIKEISAPEKYVLDNNIYTYHLSGQKTYEANITNEHKKGKIRIVKKSKEYNEITKLDENTPLENVEFEILDTNMNKVDKLVTNKYGECESNKLNTGKYYIKETKTVDGYKRLEDLIEVEIVENNDEILVQIQNDNVQIKEKLPVTGR